MEPLEVSLLRRFEWAQRMSSVEQAETMSRQMGSGKGLIPFLEE